MSQDRGFCREVRDVQFEDVRHQINRNFDESVSQLRDLCAIPSVSAQGGQPMRDAANWLVAMIRDLGGEASVHERDEGHPIVYGHIQGTSPKSLLFYNHYDVQPPDPLDQWTYPPFSGHVVDGHLYARGVSDNKGTLLSRMHAVHALLQARGSLPVSVKFLIDGEEEIGSPSLDGFVQDHHQLLRADWCLWENGYKDQDERLTVWCGNKGHIYVELRCRVADTDAHSHYAPIYPNAAWRLVWALSTLKGPDERIRIPGFYDGIIPPSEAEEAAFQALPLNVAGVTKRMGSKQLLSGSDAVEATRRHQSAPTCTLCGITSGYSGPRSKTVIPALASAKLDLRLVRGQDPLDIVAKLKAHLASEGFDDIEVELVNKVWPVKTPVDDAFVQLVIAAARCIYDDQPAVLPTSPGTSPRYVFRWHPDMPIVAIGVGWVGSNNHAPNENIRLDDYRQGIEHVAAILDSLN